MLTAHGGSAQNYSRTLPDKNQEIHLRLRNRADLLIDILERRARSNRSSTS